MGFQENYELGQEMKMLEIAVRSYDAWPRGLIKCGESMANAIVGMTKEVKETARSKAESIEPPKNLLERVVFNLGYFVGPHTTVHSICTSEGPVNPFTGKALYQR